MRVVQEPFQARPEWVRHRNPHRGLSWLGSPTRNRQQRLATNVARHQSVGQQQIIAAFLAHLPHRTGEPPIDRMKPEGDERSRLQRVDPQISPSMMGQFMGQDDVELFSRKLVNQIVRQDDRVAARVHTRKGHSRTSSAAVRGVASTPKPVPDFPIDDTMLSRCSVGRVEGFGSNGAVGRLARGSPDPHRDTMPTMRSFCRAQQLRQAADDRLMTRAVRLPE